MTADWNGDQLRVRILGAEENGDGLKVSFDVEGAGDPDVPQPLTPPQITFRESSSLWPEESGILARIFFDLASPWVVSIRVTIDLDTDAVYTATPGTDFAWDGTALSFTIPAGNTFGGVAIGILDDGLAEPEETQGFFMVSAVETEPQDGFFPGDEQECPYGTRVHVLRIAASDTPNPVMFFADPRGFRLVEGESATATARLTFAPSSTVTADIVQVAGNDPAGRVTIASGVTFDTSTTEVTVPIAAVDNGLQEDPQAYQFQLQNVVGPATIDADESVLTVQVEDPEVRFPIVGWSVTELLLGEPNTGQPSQGVVQVALTNADQNPDLSNGFSVQLQIESATLGIPDDLIVTPSSLQLTFAPFQTTRNVAFTVVRDAIDEPVEELTLRLVALAGGPVTVNPDVSRLNIDVVSFNLQGDQLRPQFEYPGMFVGPNSTNPLFQAQFPPTVDVIATIDEPFTSDVTLLLDYYGRNIVPDVNFTGEGGAPVPTEIVIPAGSLSGSIRLDFNPATSITWRFLVIEMIGTSHGQIGRLSRFTVCVEGGLDATNTIPRLPPEPAITQPTRYRLYSDRVEKLNNGGAVIQTWPHSRLMNGPDLNDFGRDNAEEWQALNPTGVRWMEEGVPLILSVEEDTPGPLGFGDHFNSLEWPNPSGPGLIPIRDYWWIGNQAGLGRRPILGPCSFQTADNRGGGQIFPAPPDNMRFVGIDFVHPGGSSPNGAWHNQTPNQIRGPEPFWSMGFMQAHDCRFYAALDPLDGTPTWTNSNQQLPKMHMRLQNPANWRVTNCQCGSAAEHFWYTNGIQGVALIGNNVVLRRLGRTLAQVVNRPGEQNGSSCGHGLILFTTNTDNDLGVGPNLENSTSALKVWGHAGRVSFINNTHTGDASPPGNNGSNRGACSVESRGSANADFVGAWVVQWPPLTGGYWNAIFVDVDDDVFEITNPAHIMRGQPYQFSGAFALSIGAIAVDLPAPQPLSTAVSFNRFSTWIAQPFPEWYRFDQRNRDVTLQIPNFRGNRQGGVRFTSGDGPTNGALTSYAPIDDAGEKFRHYDFPTDPNPRVFTQPPPVDSYNGIDPDA